MPAEMDQHPLRWLHGPILGLFALILLSVMFLIRHCQERFYGSVGGAHRDQCGPASSHRPTPF